MKIEWTELAELQFLDLLARIHEEDPRAAWRLHQRTIQWTRKLAPFPNSGRVGRMADTRELVVVGTPFVLVYAVREAAVSIEYVIHTAQQWPPEDA